MVSCVRLISQVHSEATAWQRCLSLLLGGISLFHLTGYPDEISYSSAMTACCETARWELAIELFQLMTDKSLCMNAVVFAELARACASGLQWKAMLSILGEMSKAQCQPDTLVLASSVDALESSGQVSRSLKALLDMQMLASPILTIQLKSS